MNKYFFIKLTFFLAFAGSALSLYPQTCYSDSESKSADFWLSHLFYAQCTDYEGTGSKLFEGGPYIDFGGGSSVEFNNVNVSQSGDYIVRLSYGIGYAGSAGAQMKVYTNGVYSQTCTVYSLTQNPPATIDLNVKLESGINSIKFEQSVDWPTILGIQLELVSPRNMVESVSSNNLKVNIYKHVDNKFSLSFVYKNTEYQTLATDYPVSLEIRAKALNNRYDTYTLNNKTLTCVANILTTRGSSIQVTDNYSISNNDEIDLDRKVQILSVATGDNYFNSLFGFQAAYGALTNNDYFVPGVWYKGNFDATANLPSHVPQATDTDFLYREDRLTLPLVMFRDKTSGNTISILHRDSSPQTVMADNNDEYINANYQYGSMGIVQENGTIYQEFMYPGNEKSRASGRGVRYHPMSTDVKHEYKLRIEFASSNSYAEALKSSWTSAFNIYNPTIYPVNLNEVYKGTIETLLKYFVPSSDMGGTRDAPGFPFQVSLSDFKAMGIDYQMGFVGMQIPTGYYIFREGIESQNSLTEQKGESILNFWANNSLTTLGFPRTWYDPGVDGKTGSFRSGSDIRVCTGGMEGLLTAWCFAKKNGRNKANWINACQKFGDWLVKNQNSDGSFYYSYNQNAILGDKHPASNYNKYLTICAVRYLTELYIATGNESYKDAALKAGEFCYENIHNKYLYLACVVDNPQTIDSESGQMAMNGFLSLYDLTKDSKWLNAAEQAGIYTASWTYMFDIPVENDRTSETSFPRDRSLIGQHLIAIGHGATDLGFAWSSFTFYRLYLATGNEQYLHIARISAHNSKTSMNWDQSLFPGEAKGLQLEAFSASLPRRSNGVMTTLNWNYAAHLDPMFRFKDAFGTPDLETIEQMPMDERLRLIEEYSKVQSSDYGQTLGIEENITDSDFELYPNPVHKNGSLTINIPHSNNEQIELELYDIMGRLVDKEFICATNSTYTLPGDVFSGQFFLQIKGKNIQTTKKLIVQ